MIHKGACHCGNIELELKTEIPPAEFTVRACQCSFCRKHGTRAVADPQGALTVTVRDENQLNRYRFGLQTADYLICAVCGVYVAAITRDLSAPRALAIANALEDHEAFSQAPLSMNYDAEDEPTRLARRAEKWMPMVIKTTAP